MSTITPWFPAIAGEGAPVLPPQLALLLSATIAFAGWGFRALTAAGAVVASLMGTAILWRTGWPGMAALGNFFVGASVISRLAPDPAARAGEVPGTRRDPRQVLANGGAAALGVLLAPSAAGLWIVTAALAAAAADTWATACGGWSRTDPRLVLGWNRVPAGTSGGVTLLGSAGAVVGAASVALAAALTSGVPAFIPLGLGIGMVGMLADSFLGAGLQGRFHCPRCDRATERQVHRCGSAARHIGGLRWLDNDGVNAAATAVSAGLGWLAWRIWS